MKKLKWLRWGPDSAKSDNLKKVRLRTDQMIKRQEAQKELQVDGQDNNLHIDTLGAEFSLRRQAGGDQKII